MTTQKSYKVTGMKCANCIKGATRAVAELSGYEASVFDLDAGTLLLTGDIDPAAVCRSLQDHGYPAEPIES